jgi:hypothetical protein
MVSDEAGGTRYKNPVHPQASIRAVYAPFPSSSARYLPSAINGKQFR